jgi:hypothetical protein
MMDERRNHLIDDTPRSMGILACHHQHHWPLVGILYAALCLLLVPLARAGTEYWTQLGPADSNIWRIAVAPGDPQLLLAGGDNLYRSTNAGSSWDMVPGPTGVQVLVFGTTSSLAWAGCWGPGAYRSIDGGETWEARNNGLTNTVVRSMAISPTDQNTVFATTEEGLFRTTDAGQFWSLVTEPVYTSGLAIAPSSPQTVLVGTGEGLLLSTSNGSSWTSLSIPAIDPGNSPNWIAFDPVDPEIMYVMYQGFGGGYVTIDAGLQWSPMTPGIEGFTIDADRDRPGFVYGVGGWDSPQRSGHYGLSSWSAMSAGWYGWFATGVAVDPSNSGRIYACGPQSGVCSWDSDVTPPGPATDLSAALESGGIHLTWSPPADPDVAGYRIFRSTTSGEFGLAPLATLHDGQASTYLDLTPPGNETSYYVVVSFDAAENVGPTSNETSETPTGFVDLDPSFIERTPRDCNRYIVEYTDYEEGGIPYLRAGTENDKRWPDQSEMVTFVAHIRNKGNMAAGPFTCSWSLNGFPAGDVQVAGIDPSSEAMVSLAYPWPSGFDNDHSDLTVSIEVDTNDEVAEEYEQNNVLTDFIQGLALLIYTDQETYDALTARENLVGTHSFEDWFQAQIVEMNDLMARSTYDGAPNGCLERVRIDRLTVGPPPGDPDVTGDGAWFLTGGEGYASTFALSVDYGLLHELMHQIGIIDLYNINMEVQSNSVQTPDGISSGITFNWGRPGLMGGGSIEPHPGPEHYYLSRWDVLALNSNCGYRRGYYGEFLYDVPDEMVLNVRDASGAPAAGATVRIFQRQIGTIENTPTIVGTTGPTGLFVLPNRPVAEETTTATGHTLKPNPFGTINVVGANANWLIEVSRPSGEFDHIEFVLPSLNEAYWDGNTQSWTCTIQSRLSTASLPRISSMCAAVQGDLAHLSWPPVSGASSYTVYRASRYLNKLDDPTHEFENWRYRPLITLADTTYADFTLDEASRYAVSPNAGGSPGPLSNRAFAPRLLGPRGVAVHPDGRRTVLDPQNGYALIRQDASGTYIENFGSVHNHLEYSNYMANDATRGRLVISHPGDEYSGRQSVKVTDLEGTTVLEVGDTGADPGQMIAPAGVAVDGLGRIYVADAGNHRVQAFDLDGGFLAAFGAEGSGAGEFLEMRGIGVDTQGRVFVCDPGNGRIAVLSFEGSQFEWLTTIADVASPNSAIAGPLGRIYVSDAATNSVREYSPELACLRSFEYPSDLFTGHLANPTGMAVDALGSLIVCDTGNRRVAMINILDPAGAEEAGATTLTLRLLPSHPNPFDRATRIRFDLPRASLLSLRIYDAAGRLVRGLIDAQAVRPGSHEVAWDGRNAAGRPVAAGVYFARLICGGEVRTERCVRIR